MTTRRGLSLMEVMIALAILVGSAAVLSQLIDKGRRHAMRAADVTEAQSIGNNVMVELLAGIRPWESSSAQPVDPYQPWDYSVQIEPTEIDEIAVVKVAVFRRLPPNSLPLQQEAAERRAFRLVRWVRRPINLVDEPPTSEAINATATPRPIQSANQTFVGS